MNYPDITCFDGYYSECYDCDFVCIGTLEIPIGDIDRFVILHSPILECICHKRICYIYGWKNEEERLFLGPKDKLLNAIRWYTLISYQDNNNAESVRYAFGRRYHITEKLLHVLINTVFTEC